MRRNVVVLAVVDVLLVVAGTVGAIEVRSRGVTAARVMARPWPERVTPTAAWSARVEGTGSRVAFTQVAGVVPGGLSQAAFIVRPAGRYYLALPDETRWYPEGPFRFDAPGDLPFVTARANGKEVSVTVGSLSSVLAHAPDPVAAIGRFVSPDGRRVDRITVPRGTLLSDCPRRPCPVSYHVPDVSLPAREGTVLRAQSGVEIAEAAVAGSIRAEALGRRWDGLVGAVEGTGLTSTATWDGEAWSLSATADHAAQLWVDVWPVADTTLSATSDVQGGGFLECERDCRVRIRWTNTGRATSQVYEAEGVGAGGPSVGFDLNKSSGHDAGLGVRRGDRKVNLGKGGDVDSNQAPGEKVERGLSYAPGTDVTLVLRGNFPDVHVRLAIPAA